MRLRGGSGENNIGQEETAEEGEKQTESWRVGDDGICAEGGVGLGTRLGAGRPGGKNDFGQFETLAMKVGEGRGDEAAVLHHHWRGASECVRVRIWDGRRAAGAGTGGKLTGA